MKFPIHSAQFNHKHETSIMYYFLMLPTDAYMFFKNQEKSCCDSFMFIYYKKSRLININRGSAK